MNTWDILQQRASDICVEKGWSRDWWMGGCYLHLETSEFIEALRGKGSESPTEEAADVLFVLLSILRNYKISVSDVQAELERKMDALQVREENLENYIREYDRQW